MGWENVSCESVRVADEKKVSKRAGLGLASRLVFGYIPER
jgi:hypothetical protein